MVCDSRLTSEVQIPIRKILLTRKLICKSCWSTVKAEAKKIRDIILEIMVAAVAEDVDKDASKAMALSEVDKEAVEAG